MVLGGIPRVEIRDDLQSPQQDLVTHLGCDRELAE